MHKVTSFGLSWKIWPESFTKEFHSRAALNNLNKSSTGLYRQQREARKVSFLHVTLQSPSHVLITKALKHVNSYKKSNKVYKCLKRQSFSMTSDGRLQPLLKPDIIKTINYKKFKLCFNSVKMIASSPFPTGTFMCFSYYLHCGGCYMCTAFESNTYFPTGVKKGNHITYRIRGAFLKI